MSAISGVSGLPDVSWFNSGANPAKVIVLAPRLNFRQIADELAEEIIRGERPPRSKLPSYSELADLYDVSVTTAYRAVRLLHERGLVYGEHGRGVYVAVRTERE